MKTLLRCLPLLALGFVALRAAESSVTPDSVTVLTAADDERVAALVAADPARLGSILSDQLHYAHSNGHLDTKASLIDAVTSHRTVYDKIEYTDREFRLAAPGVAVMTGRAVFYVASGGTHRTLPLSFLAVWRNEAGHWRFFAWQSCHLPEPEKQ